MVVLAVLFHTGLVSARPEDSLFLMKFIALAESAKGECLGETLGERIYVVAPTVCSSYIKYEK
ncbi:hypothetical protein [Azospirillum palustre]